MAKILITGSSGFLGSATVKHFRERGHTVTGVDIVASKSTDKVQDIRYFVNNNKEHYDKVFHFSAYVGGRANIENNYLQMIENIEIDRVVFEWAKSNTQHLIYPSSSAVYPTNFQDTYENHTPLSEDMINFETNNIGVSDHLYGWCKLTAERMLWEINKKSKLQITIFRPFSGYGVGQSMSYPFPNLINEVRSNPRHVKVWGTGLQTRDFIHINDILFAFEKSFEFKEKYLVLNLGSGTGTAFNSLVRTMSKVLYNIDKVEIENLVDKPTGVLNRVANVKKQARYNLLPKVNLEQGILYFNEE